MPVDFSANLCRDFFDFLMKYNEDVLHQPLAQEVHRQLLQVLVDLQLQALQQEDLQLQDLRQEDLQLQALRQEDLLRQALRQEDLQHQLPALAVFFYTCFKCRWFFNSRLYYRRIFHSSFQHWRFFYTCFKCRWFFNPGSTTGGSSTPGSSTGGSSTPGSTTGGSSTPASSPGGSSTPGSTTGGSSTPGSSTEGPSTSWFYYRWFIYTSVFNSFDVLPKFQRRHSKKLRELNFPGEMCHGVNFEKYLLRIYSLFLIGYTARANGISH
ncbi:hypothetical protein CEXT_543141 [Caerostris extrusa]|uniref:Uncharacterized protein n=1 Tax=Caerostris extrusa TaxID=172846 RepID=A0AAV4TNH4_CAEEX|nr:hypothetical protein CEXT_543141 [Caerostris extrusa]